MTTELDVSPRATSRRWKISSLGLLCSICLNVAFASYITIQALPALSQSAAQVEREEGPGEGNPESMVRKFADRLPNRDAEILWQVYRTKETQILAATAAARSSGLQVRSVLAQRDLDAAALEGAYKEAMDNRMRAAQLLTETVMDALKRISPEGRMQLMKR